MTEQTEVKSYKGFDINFKCRDHQFAVGESYTIEGDVKAGELGFHACAHPLDVLGYYTPGDLSRYAIVTQSGDISRDGSDSKLASRYIRIDAEITLDQLIDDAITKTIRESVPSSAASATGYGGAASATGDRGAASATGYGGAASATGHRGAASATGYRGAASATGYGGAASATGDRGAASATGYRGAASAKGYGGAASATGDRGAASATGDSGAASATGYGGAASATGDRGTASATGYRGAASATGDRGAASATGDRGRVIGAVGCALFLVYRDPDNEEILHAWAGIAGRDGIKPMTWYMLDESGEPVEVV